MRISRRAALLGVGGGAAGVAGVGALVETGVLPGRDRARRLLGQDGVSFPDVEPGPVHRGTLAGSDWLVCEPPGGGAGLPVVLAYHGASYTTDDLLSQFGVDRFLAASGERFVLAAVDDLALTLDGLRPLLGREGYDVRRPALLGWSRGGHVALEDAIGGAVDLAAVALASPALSGPDDPGGAEALRGLPLRIDCGRQDPFYDAVTAFADRLDELDVDAEVSISPGAHTVDYWTGVLPAQLTWLGARV